MHCLGAVFGMGILLTCASRRPMHGGMRKKITIEHTPWCTPYLAFRLLPDFPPPSSFATAGAAGFTIGRFAIGILSP